MKHMIVRLAVGLCLVFGTVAPASGARAEEFAGECDFAPDGPSLLAVGVVDCLRIDASSTLGAPAPFSYYIPPRCDPGLGRTCPVLYLLHGTGGDYRSSLGAKGSEGSAYVHALTSGPAVDPSHVADPWNHADPESWIPLEPLDMILVAPHGRTLPDGFGPVEDADAAWLDWNPRYAAGGSDPTYDTPAPRFDTHLTSELVPYVDAHFPTVGHRTWRAIIGTSLGGFGSFARAFLHPDVWSSAGMVSGANGPWHVAPDLDVDSPIGIAPPAPVPYTRLPGPTTGVAREAAWTVLYGPLATVGFGDIAADHVWWRGTNPADLAPNARASAGGQQSIHLRYFVNDTVPRRAEDVQSSRYYLDQGFETIIFPTNLELEAVFDNLGVERSFEIHPGLHSGVYWAPFYRQQLAAQYAVLHHPDGSGSPLPDPTVFDYRTVHTAFEIWGWRFDVDREPVEFLNLSQVSCRGLTLRGTGIVTATVPQSCATGLNGDATFTVDLGPSQATDEPSGAGSTTAYGKTIRVELEPLDG